MIIYVDVLFIENLILDFIIILATEIICSNKIKIGRVLIASCIASFLTIIFLIVNFNKTLSKIIISFLVILIVFGIKGRKNFIKHILTFYLITIIFGGTSFLLLFSINPQKIIYYAGKFLGTYPVKIAICRRNFGFLSSYYC